MKKVEITLELEHPMPSIVIQSLQPELKRSTIPKTQINISETNVGLKLTIEAESTSALRAALNSHLRWINCIVTTANTFKLEEQGQY